VLITPSEIIMINPFYLLLWSVYVKQYISSRGCFSDNLMSTQARFGILRLILLSVLAD